MKTATAPKGMPCRRGRYKYCGLDIFLVCVASPRLLAPGITIGCLLVVVVIVACNTATNDSVVGALLRASITISCSTGISEYKQSIIRSSTTVIANNSVSTRCAEEVETGAGTFFGESTIETGIFFEELNTGGGIFLEEELDTDSAILPDADLDREADIFFEELNTGGGIFLEEGLDTDSAILPDADLDREADIFFEELNTGSEFIKSRCGYPYLEP